MEKRDSGEEGNVEQQWGCMKHCLMESAAEEDRLPKRKTLGHWPAREKVLLAPDIDEKTFFLFYLEKRVFTVLFL